MKKLSLFILLLLCIAFSANAQEAPESFTSGPWIYQANNSGWTIVDYMGDEKDITIPDSFDGKPVTQLSEGLFMNYMPLEKAAIPNSVTVIGKNLFQGCANLKEVTLSLNIKAIPEGMFRYCSSLENVALPLSVTSIGKEAFMHCEHLSSISIPQNVTYVAESAFLNCKSLQTIYMGRKISLIDADAFKGTAWLESQTNEFVFIGRGILIKYNGNARQVEIPYGTVFISNAFEGNTTVESIVLPDTVQKIMHNAFKDAVNLSSINIPQYTTYIGWNAFGGCRRLNSIDLPGSITTIGGNAFRGCEQLSDLVIPSKVKDIQSMIGAECPGLTGVRLPSGITKFNKNAFTGSPNVTLQVVPGSQTEETLKGLEIPYTYIMNTGEEENKDFIFQSDGVGITLVKYIGTLYDVEIPADINGLPVTAIGTAAFQNNPSVRRVLLPLTVKSIGDWAFSYMDSLHTVVLQSGMESIGANVFTGDPNLAELKLPGGVKEVGLNILDREAATKVCAAEGSGGYDLLTADGYWVRPLSECSADDALLDEWTLKNLTVGMTVDPELLGPNPGAYDLLAARYGSSVEIVRIPDETKEVTLSLLYGTGDNVILMVPKGVTAIDPEILDGRSLTIVGDTGTYAEQFARDNNVKFIVRVISWTGE